MVFGFLLQVLATQLLPNGATSVPLTWDSLVHDIVLQGTLISNGKLRDFSEKNEKTRSQRSRKCYGTTAWFLVAFYCKLPKKEENYFFRWFFHDFSEGGRWGWRGLEKLKIMIFFFEARFLHEILVKSLRGCEKRILLKILHRYR